MTLQELYKATRALDNRLIDNNSIVGLGQPLHWLYVAIAFDTPVNLRLVPKLEEYLLTIEPEFKADLHALLDAAKQVVQS